MPVPATAHPPYDAAAVAALSPALCSTPAAASSLHQHPAHSQARTAARRSCYERDDPAPLIARSSVAVALAIPPAAKAPPHRRARATRRRLRPRRPPPPLEPAPDDAPLGLFPTPTPLLRLCRRRSAAPEAPNAELLLLPRCRASVPTATRRHRSSHRCCSAVDLRPSSCDLTSLHSLPSAASRRHRSTHRRSALPLVSVVADPLVAGPCRSFKQRRPHPPD
ncbi:hypothetical protein EUGRSUZ_D01401 [Eucalyptus grandis]|uniref:Uncharacterized protein n=2 Tax=Eucalyptus grandis TaxID=71139 RepID=A0ACC3L675_EUCGR|nr:hypothetical protein EUGRSUZ_D01401 [Eucalyptus grandis]